MIARLRGTLLEKQPDRVVVDAGGVGYLLSIPLSTYYELGDPGSPIELHVHTHVREDALALFGFRTTLERALFARLIAVNGVGPKTALAVLSGVGVGELVAAVGRRDAESLSAVPGIGRKTAERIIVDLADRLEGLAGKGQPEGTADGAAARGDLVSALVNLGYNARAAGQAVDRALRDAGAEDREFQSLLRRSLQLVSR